MGHGTGMPRGAAIAIDDLLDKCARISAGQEVLILAHVEGLYGGDNLVDQQTVSWIASAVKQRGANASVLWTDEPAKAHAWRVPSVVKAAIKGCDVFINHSFDLVTEEIMELRQLMFENDVIIVRNFATTAPLLCTTWAQTPHELVSEIRYQASVPFKAGLSFELTDENGTHLVGTIGAPDSKIFPEYTTRRDEAGGYRPWPEWVIPPINIRETSGLFAFDRMLSWWSRYIGISPYFQEPIRLTIEENRIREITGGSEADALKTFLGEMECRLGKGVYDFNQMHCGVHPQARVEPHQCPSSIYRRLIEHSHTSNVHVHIGSPPALPTYNYWMHCTGDIRRSTWRIGDTVLLDRGRMTVLDHPAVREIAEKYGDRPNIAGGAGVRSR
jgi:hypothetical protein